MYLNEKEFDKDLARIVSYLTFDGHLAEDLKCFYLSSKDSKMLLDFKNLIKKKFKIIGKIEEGTGYGKSYKYRICNKRICLFLESAGTPKGNKVLKEFLIPAWIMHNADYSKAYLDVAFDCEGSVWFEKKPKIRFGIYKIESKIDSGMKFIELIRLMLSRLGIKTTNPWIIKGNLRLDGKETKGIYFKIEQSSVKKFSQQIKLTNTFKNQRLSLI